jgi:hypothetical protein
MLVVWIDERHGRIAKHVALVRPDALAEMTDGLKLPGGSGDDVSQGREGDQADRLGRESTRQ